MLGGEGIYIQLLGAAIINVIVSNLKKCKSMQLSSNFYFSTVQRIHKPSQLSDSKLANHNNRWLEQNKRPKRGNIMRNRCEINQTKRRNEYTKLSIQIFRR